MRSLVIDCRFAATPSGLGRFTRGWTAALLHVAPTETAWTFLVKPGQKSWWHDQVNVTLIETDVPHYSLAEQFVLPRLMKGLRADAFISPHFNAPLFTGLPTIITVHDLILHRYPNQASLLRQLAYRLSLRLSLAKATVVQAVSPYVVTELRSVYGPSLAAKATVIGEGVEDTFIPASPAAQAELRARYHLDRPFLLYVGNAKEHKNVPALLEAFKQAALPDTDLVLIASGKEADAMTWPPHVRRLKEVPDADFPAFYSAAAACVTMSRYEGFCLPLVEALACGCPVIAPALSAIPDTVGSGAGVRLLEDLSPETFATAFRSLPNRPAPTKLSSWDGPANISWSLIEKVLSQKS